MFKNSKVKKLLAFSVISSGVLFCGASASATMKRTPPSASGAGSSNLSRTRITAGGEPLGMTWSQRRTLKQESKKGTQGTSETSSQSVSVGTFPVRGIGEVQLNIYEGRTQDGMTNTVIKTDEGLNRSVVKLGNGKYSLTLGFEEMGKLGGNVGEYDLAVDLLGNNRIVVGTGKYPQVAYQPDTGLVRDVHPGSDGRLHLGAQVNINDLPESVRPHIQKLVDDISRKYASKILKAD